MLSFLKGKGQSKENLSVPPVKNVYGYEVRKMPAGRWLEAKSMIAEMPATILGSIFPDMNMEEAVNQVIELIDNEDYASLITLATEFVLSAPEIVISLVSHCINVDSEELLEDEELGIDGLVKLVVEIIEVNKLGEVVQNVRGLINKKNETIE